MFSHPPTNTPCVIRAIFRFGHSMYRVLIDFRYGNARMAEEPSDIRNTTPKPTRTSLFWRTRKQRAPTRTGSRTGTEGMERSTVRSTLRSMSAGATWRPSTPTVEWARTIGTCWSSPYDLWMKPLESLHTISIPSPRTTLAQLASSTHLRTSTSVASSHTRRVTKASWCSARILGGLKPPARPTAAPAGITADAAESSGQELVRAEARLGRGLNEQDGPWLGRSLFH